MKYKEFSTRIIITLGDIEIEKGTFYYSKCPINAYNVGIENLVISNKFSFSKKGFRYYI